MNNELWKKYLNFSEIEKTMPATDVPTRNADLKFLAQFLDFKNKKVLDVGCEEGEVLKHLKKEFGCEVTGTTLGAIYEQNKHFIKKADMHELPFEDNSFDAVLIMHTLEHAISPYIVLAEINRVLKIGGKIIVIMPEEGDVYTSCKQHYSTMTFRQLFNLLNKTGFIPIKNYRKEYEINEAEWKRDILAVWEKKETNLGSLLENSLVYIPSLGEQIMLNVHIKLTPILIFSAIETELMNHFIGRTDSLKTG